MKSPGGDRVGSYNHDDSSHAEGVLQVVIAHRQRRTHSTQMQMYCNDAY